MSEHDHDIDMRDEYDFSDARRGPIVPPAAGKTRITIRLDNDILDWFRAQVHRDGGGNYQTLINHALREAMSRAQREGPSGLGYVTLRWEPGQCTPRSMDALSPLRELVREVVREELGERFQASSEVIEKRAKKEPRTSE
jgi:uncharacterized protein (DUF4415 family)